MGMNRKGVFFSLAALMIVGMLFMVLHAENQREDTDTKFRIIQAVQRTCTGIADDQLPLALREQARDALNVLALDATAVPYANTGALEAAFTRCLSTDACGQGDTSNVGSDLLANISEKLNEATGYPATITLVDVTLQQISSDELRVRASYRIDCRDAAGTAGYEGALRTVETRLSVQNLPDPYMTRLLRARDANARPHIIRLAARMDADEEWTPETLLAHASRGTYVYDEHGISYLERFLAEPRTGSAGIHALLPPGYHTQPYSSLDRQAETDLSEGCYFSVADTQGGRVYIPAEYALAYDLAESRFQTGQCATTGANV